jgi:hypothetical protein
MIRTGTSPVAPSLLTLYSMWYVEIFQHSGVMALLHGLGQSTEYIQYELNKSGLQ